MKMKFGAIVVDGRNKIGGHVASKNRAGAYLRTKVTPVNPRSAGQSGARSRLASMAQAWRGLTASERQSWIAAVNDFKKSDIFGDIKVPSGFNLFVKLNTNLLLSGNPINNTAPAFVNPGNVTSFALTATESGHVLTGVIIPATDPSGSVLCARATPQLSAGKSFVKSEFRVISTGVTNTTGAIDLALAYSAKFGDISDVGSKVFVELFYLSEATGITGRPFQANAIVG